MALGLGYSADLPLLRWKRSPALAAGSIMLIRAFAVQFGFFMHMTSSVLQRYELRGHIGILRRMRS